MRFEFVLTPQGEMQLTSIGPARPVRRAVRGCEAGCGRRRGSARGARNDRGSE